MKRTFALVALVLGLGYAVPLVPLPWNIGSVGVEAMFLQQSWFLSLVLLFFNLVGAFLLFRVEKDWPILALSYSLIQVAIWWLLSGLLAMNGDLVQFFSRKTNAIWMLLHHSDPKVVFVTVHQDITMGVFYHLAFLWLLIYVLSNRNHHDQVAPAGGQVRMRNR